MFLKHMPSSDLIEVLDLNELVNPCRETITGCSHAGEEMQEPASFQKAALIFPSGEALPQCWVDPHYQKKM
ncbi:MAG: acetyltransferase [Nitrococcus sp.]|nr:acetyltransferase [Nitrococcus sp.]